MNRCSGLRNLTSPLVIILTAGAFLFPSSACGFDSEYPEEPEKFDSEYYLDMLTMHQDRGWRALSDSRDNLFKLDFGSLNVEQWVLMQSLKFSAPLSGNLRFRYWLDEIRSLGPEGIKRNELEIEWNSAGNFFVSFYLQPAFWKRNNDIGIGIQTRKAVDIYWKLIFRIRDFANNFAYRHGDNIEEEENIYTTQPLEIELEAVDRSGGPFLYGISAQLSNRWEKEFRFIYSPEDNYISEGYKRVLKFWIEADLWSRYIFCLDAGYAEYFSRVDNREEKHTLAELLPQLWWYPGGTGKGKEDPWRLREGSAAFSAGIQLRRERWEKKGAQQGSFDKDEYLPFLLARYSPASWYMLEAGYLADSYESSRTGAGAGSDLRWENRLKLMWEIRMGERGFLRIIETIDLDSDDWGQFSVHDHFFVMTRVTF